MSKVRVGVAGLGRGAMFVELFEKDPRCEVVAVCDPLEQALANCERIRGYTDYEAFLGVGLDIVAVITPGPVHARQSIMAMESGAHVLCETPCVYSVDEADAVLETAERRARCFMLAEDYIWMGWAVHIKKQAEAGRFGNVVYAEGDYTHDCRDFMLRHDGNIIPYADRNKYPDVEKTWRVTDLPPLFYTSHTLGPLLHIMDDRIVSAIGVSTGTHTAPELGTIDLEVGLFETAKGAVIRLTNGFTVAHPYALFYSLVGTEGSIKVQRGAGDTCIWYSEKAEQPMNGWETVPADQLRRPDGMSNVAVMTREFVDSIVNGTPPPLDARRSMDFVLPGILAHESAMRGGEKLAVPVR